MNKNHKLVGEAKTKALIEAAYQKRIKARYGKNSVEYSQVAIRKNWNA